MSVRTSWALPRRSLVTRPGALQDGDVLLHRGEAHRVVAGEVRHRVLAPHRPPDDVAAGRVGERVEHEVGAGVVGKQIYNHLVVD